LCQLAIAGGVGRLAQRRKQQILIFCTNVLVEIVRLGDINSRNFHSTCCIDFIDLEGRMHYWQHAATLLAFALIAGVIVFAGHDHHAIVVSDTDARITGRAVTKLELSVSGSTASAPVKRMDVSECCNGSSRP
jgi:hypothetical protein